MLADMNKPILFLKSHTVSLRELVAKKKANLKKKKTHSRGMTNKFKQLTTMNIFNNFFNSQNTLFKSTWMSS